jgi:dCTP deaminase
MAQPGSASVWGTEGRRFESCWPDQVTELNVYRRVTVRKINVRNIINYGSGVLASQQIKEMVANNLITSETSICSEQIQPASLDLRLGRKAIRVRASFLTGRHTSVLERIKKFKMHEVELDAGTVLERGCVYVIPLMERLNLPAELNAVCNAKSSTGRLDLLTRIITDEGVEFDRIESGYSGPLFAEICPRSFSVLVRPGMRLSQIRFRAGQSILSDDELLILHKKETLVSDQAHIDQGLGFSVDLKPIRDNVVGYRAKPHSGVIDLDKISYYNPLDFWEELKTSDGSIVLDPGAFYILVSREAVNIPSAYAAEMAPYLAMVGEFRVHYAGFFDPGFGNKIAGGSGSRGVLEVRCHEAPFVLEHGQIVGRLVYERMAKIPNKLYGTDLKSHYQGQGLKLSKHFKSF